jgi:hypothetical protein
MEGFLSGIAEATDWFAYEQLEPQPDGTFPGTRGIFARETPAQEMK